jgi:hypothetical protein
MFVVKVQGAEHPDICRYMFVAEVQGAEHRNIILNDLNLIH